MGKAAEWAKVKMNPARFIVSIIACIVVGFIGSLFTMPKIASWYSFLIKPSWTPPNWAFGPVWTTLFMLMGIALYLMWQKYPRAKGSKFALQLFAVQFAFNIVWSCLFFGLESPLYGLIGIVALWISIMATIFAFYRVSKPAVYVLVPYILWVTVAMFLNYSVLVLN